MVEGAGPSVALRATLQRSGDPRVARTRAAILDAVQALVAGEAATISASDVIRAAGVSRATFYAHFEGLDGLAVAVLERAFVEIRDAYEAEVVSGDPTAGQALVRSQVRLVEHVAQRRSFYACVFSLPVTQETYLAGVRVMAQTMEPTLAAHPTRPRSVDPALAARYTASAAFGLLHAWVRGDVDATAEQVVDHLLDLMPHWLTTR